jgi:hypothetical protein
MTGPSLAGVIGRKAGALASFQRYSPALKSSNVIWNEETLDAWLAKPDAFIPGSRMTFEGIKPVAIRADIIAYLKSAMTSPKAQLGPKVGVPGDPDLKKLDLLPGYLSSDNRRRSDPRVLGAQLALQDRPRARKKLTLSADPRAGGRPGFQTSSWPESSDRCDRSFILPDRIA